MSELPGANAPIHDASTVLTVRDGSAGPEVYLVQRHRGNKFIANAHVFVGGRVDEADRAATLEPHLFGRDAAERMRVTGFGEEARARGFYVAAVREAFEESGLLLAVDGAGVMPKTTTKLTRARDELNDGKLAFEELLRRCELRLPLEGLRLLARWVTPPFEVRRFDTLFFVARVSEQQEASYDARETSGGRWWRIEEVLEAQLAEQVKLAPPTLCVLEDLRGCADVDALLAAATDRPTPPISPRLDERARELTLLMPDDHRYSEPDSKSGPEHYLVLEGAHWVRTRR